MKDYLNMDNTIINYALKRLDCELPPKPVYPCKNFNNNNWDHYNKCDKCDFGVWKFYKQKERK